MYYALKALIMYVAAIVAMRMMGKSTIGQMTVFDLVIIFMVGAVIAEPLASKSLPTALMGLTLLVIFQTVISYLSMNDRLRRLIVGEPIVLIEGGRISEKNLFRAQIAISQLLSELRLRGFHNVNDVECAILEPSGELSVMPKSQKRPLTPQDLGLSTNYEGLPIHLIINGEIQKENLQIANLDEEWLRLKVRERGIDDTCSVFLASLDTNGNLYIDPVSVWQNKICRDKP